DDAPDGPAWSLADSVPAGTTAAVALIEHLWAAPLRAAIRRTGGVPLDEIWLAEADLQRLAASSPCPASSASSGGLTLASSSGREQSGPVATRWSDLSPRSRRL